MVFLLFFHFVAQVYLVMRSGKALEDNMHNKTSGAKFISRTQIRTFASASSVNASTGQLQHPDNRLSESEAIDEIKQFAQQLQRLYERIPRGPITNVILTLLDICKSVQSTNQLTLKPPLQALPPVKKLSICDPNCVDKETNTSLENFLQWQEEQTNNGCKYIISDKCDNNQKIITNNNNKTTSRNNKCCNQEQITCSTNSINFDNLQLQCMCSSDNNSIVDEYQNENCDNCTSHNCSNNANANNKIGNPMPQSNSFREKLLCHTTLVQNVNRSASQYASSHQANSNLLKRNSELVLGTNFEQTPYAFTNVRTKIPKNYESCDNLYNVNKQPMSDCPSRNKLTSNYSLSGETSESNNQKVSVERDYSVDRPIMKMSQSEDDNLKELKIALSSTLSSANGQNICPSLHQQQILQQQQRQKLMSNPKLILESQSITSSSSSCKIDKSQSISSQASSATDALAKKVRDQQLQQQQSINSNELDDSAETDGAHQQDTEKSDINIGDNGTSSNNNYNEITKKNITANNNNIKSQQNINNTATHASNANGKKRKSPDGKLTLDLNDRSKYGEEVSV